MMVPQTPAQMLAPEAGGLPALDADGAPAAASPAEQRRASSDASSGHSSGTSDSSASSGDDSGSSSSDASSSEDDLSDNETLADRHKSLKRADDDTHQKRRRSSSDSGSGKSGRRKRRNLFPVIRKSQRCGKCHTCLNPQLKKACLTVREKMMREATKGNKRTAQPSKPAPQQQPAHSSSSSADVDKYTDILLPFINSAGALSDVASVQSFIKAMGRFNSSIARTLPCTVLGLSSSPVLAEFMARGGVDVLSSWLLQAMEEDSDNASQFLVEALSTLKKLPVDKAFVQSTKSAKVIGALRKHDNSDVRRLARDIVTLWMKCIPPSTTKSSSSKPPAAAGAQRPAEAAAAAAQPAAKRLRTTAQEHAAAAAAALSQPKLAPGGSANGAAAARAAGAGAAAAAGAGGIHVVSDNDLFKAAAGPAKPKVPIGQRLKQQPKRTNLVQTIDPAEASRLLSGKPAAGPAAAGSSAAAAAASSQQQAAGTSPGQQQDQQQQQQPEPRVQLELQVRPEAGGSLQVVLHVMPPPLKSSLRASQPAAAAPAVAAGAAAATAGSRGPTTSSVSRLPGSRRMSFGAGLGARGVISAAAAGSSGAAEEPAGAGSSSSISALLGGAWAHPGSGGTAGAGAGAGEEDEPAAKRSKKAGPVKRVAWKQERELVAVRWFIKDDPPAQACKDAHLTDEQLRALSAAHHHHAAFDQAARMEHARERQLIEQQHKAAEDAAAAMRQQIDAMQPTTEWYGPAPAVALDASWQVAAGEDSTEAKRCAQTLQQLLANLQTAPPGQQEPLESHQLLQPPNALFNVPYHDRNVKIVPLNTVTTVVAAAPAAQPQQQQQQQPLQQPVVLDMQQQQPTQVPTQQPFPMQGVVMQQPQQQQQQVLLPGLQPQQQPQQPQQPLQQLGGQLVLQQLPQQQQLQHQLAGPPPPAMAGMFAAPGSSGLSSGGNQQAQLLQALQSLTQLQSQGGLPVVGQQVQMQMQVQPGSSAPQVISVSGGMQLMLPSGMMVVQPGQGQGQLQLPPGVVLAPMGHMPPQQQQPQVLHMQYEQPGAPQHHQQQQPLPMGWQGLGHRPMMRDDEYQQQQWGGPLGGHGEGGYRHEGRGPGAGENAPWRRIKRECKFFNTARGCQKGDACGFKHILPGESGDVRDRGMR